MHSKIIVKLRKKKGCRNALDRDEVYYRDLITGHMGRELGEFNQ